MVNDPHIDSSSGAPVNAPVARLPVPVWIALLCSIGACAFVLSQKVPMWATGMFYGFSESRTLPAAALVIPLLLVQCGVHYRLWGAARTGQRRREAGWLAALCLLMLCLNLALRSGENTGLVSLATITVDPASGGYYLAAFDADNLQNWVAEYPRLMHGHHHVETHPPGGVALMRWFRERARRSSFWADTAQEALIWSPGVQLDALAGLYQRIWKRNYQTYDVAAAWWAGLSLTVCAALLPAAIYALARPLCGAPAAAHAAGLTALVPSFALLSPALDMLIALCAASALALCVHALLKNKIGLALAGGIIAGIGLIFSFAMLAPLLMACGFYMWQAQRGAVPWRRVWAVGSALAAGVGSVVLITAMMGVPWLTIYHLTHEFQAAVMIHYNRPWRLWIWFNLVDFFFFLGLPCLVLLIWALRHRVKPGSDGVAAKERLNSLLLPAIGVILLVHFGANVWAESARIWMLFVPPLMVGTGYALHRLSEKAPAALPLILLAQSAQLMAMAAALNVWSF